MNGVLSDMPQGVLMGEQIDPRSAMLMQMGLGLLSNSGPSLTPHSFGQSFGQAGMQGMQAYQQAQQANRNNLLMNMQAMQLKKEMAKQDALAALFSPTGPKAVGVAPVSASGSTAPQQVAQGPGSFSPIPVDRLAAAAAQGVNIEPFLKLNAEARPDLHFQDTGNEIVVTDKKTMKTVQRIPKSAAPGSVPFEAQDIKPEGYRDFLLKKSTAGASQQVTNVNSFTPASEEAQKKFMDSTRTNYEALRNAPVTLKNIEEAKALVPSAQGFMGPGGEGLLEAAKFLKNRLGINVNTEGVKSAEELRSRVFMQIMDNLKKMDAQPSQMQQQVMQDALGKLGTDPNALPAVLDSFAEVIRGKVDIHNREVQGASSRGVKFPYDPVINLPEPKKAEPAIPRNRIRYDAQGNRL